MFGLALILAACGAEDVVDTGDWASEKVYLRPRYSGFELAADIGESCTENEDCNTGDCHPSKLNLCTCDGGKCAANN